MIGLIAGDIIGSPYRNNNTEDEKRHHFTLFASSEKVTLDPQRRRASSRSYEAKPTAVTSGALEVARWLLDTDRSAASLRQCLEDGGVKRSPTPIEALAMLSPVGEFAATADEAVGLGAVAMTVLSSDTEDIAGAQAWSRLCWMASHGGTVREMSEVAREEFGESLGRTPAEYRALLTGAFVENDSRTLTLGEGKAAVDWRTVLPAVITLALGGESCEDVVRRAVALGGDSSTVAALAGALSEPLFKDLGDDVRKTAGSYLLKTSLDEVGRFERLSARKEMDIAERPVLSNAIRVISRRGKTPVFVIPEGREDLEAAVRASGKSLYREDVEIIRPDRMRERLEELSVQRDAAGNPLGGVYIEHARPEVKTLWVQNGKLVTSTTRAAEGSGETMPSIKRRAYEFNDFLSLKDYAEDVRRELERQAGHDPAKGHLHFTSAFYPVVGDRVIDLMEGDVLRGRVRLDDSGRIRVDTGALTGSDAGEYLEGVLASMDIFHAGDNVKDIRLTLDEYCLDSGRIEDEQERGALSVDDENAAGVKMKYRSNLDRAVADLATVRGELPVAVLQRTVKEQRRAERRESAPAKVLQGDIGAVMDSRSHAGEVFTIGHGGMDAAELERLLRRWGIELVVDVRSWPKAEYAPQFDMDRLQESLQEAGIDYASMGYDEERGRAFALAGRQRRPKSETYVLYRHVNAEGGTVRCGLYRSDAECSEAARRMNRGVPSGSPGYVTGMRKVEREEYDALVAAKEITPEFRARCEVMTGKYLSYEEIMETKTFQDNLRNLREAVRSGVRIALLGSESDPASSHRFALVGRALEHPADGRVNPVRVQHITRRGYLVSQSDLEGRMMESMGMKSQKERLGEAFARKGVSILTKTRENSAISLTMNARKAGGRKI